MITHVVPVSAWLERREIDTLQMDRHAAFLPMPRGSGGTRGSYEHPNLEGFFTFDQSRDELGVHAYLQSFRDGAFERVTSYLFRPLGSPWPDEAIIGDYVERELIEGVKDVIELLRHVDVAPPMTVLATLLGVRGRLVLAAGRRGMEHDRVRLTTDMMRLPDVVVDDFDASLPRVLRPIIETFWQAGGWWRSPSYDDAGDWQPFRD